MNVSRPEGAEASYDAVADEYTRRIFHELDDKPLDREWLDRFAARMRGKGVVADIGCGPGHVTRYLHERGVQVCGVDLSSAMIECARELNPGIEFLHADMRALRVPDGSWAGIVAFYSLIHIARDLITQTLREFRRLLRPGGWLLLSFHCGDETLHLDEWWGHQVSLDFLFFHPDEMTGYLAAAGFTVEEVTLREPYAPDVEHQSRRCYMLARRRSEATPIGAA